MTPKQIGRSRKVVQLGLAARGRLGGFRTNAGRKKKPEGTHRRHRPRASLASRFPVHVTLKVKEGAPGLRRRACFRALRSALVAGKDRFGMRLSHFTVQGNHLHLICEAKDRVALSRGMQGLAVRMARRLNKAADRTGKLFAERYHARILRTPTEVRRALVYVLNNSRRHAPRDVTFAPSWVEPLSSAQWFDGWKGPVLRWKQPDGEVPVCAPGTWLLRTGWRRLGRIAPDEVPRGD